MGQSGSSMQLTRAADYAVRVVIHLATLPPHERTLLPALARATGTPENFLSKILQSLCRAGLIASWRGKSGGFEILAPGREASIRTVIEAIDGPICLNICLISGASCSRKSFCPAHPIWASAQEAMLSVLNTARVADLAVQAVVPRGKGSTIQPVSARPRMAGKSGGRPARKRASHEDEAPALQSEDSKGLEIVAQ
jgi:Rrf2 family protein